MAKKSAKGPRPLPNPDAFQRINYLLHLSQQIILIAHSQIVKAQPEGTRLTPAFLKANLAQELALAQSYIKTLREVARKAVIRL
jgi:RNase P subunit RPR2